MKRVRKPVLLAIISFAVLAFAQNTQADPLFFSNTVALQNDSSTRVDLFSNPGTTLFGQQISFLVDVTGTLPPNTTNVLQITYTPAGGTPQVQTFSVPLFGTVQPPFTQLFTISSTGATLQGIAATLTIDILGSDPDFIIPGGPNAGQLVNSFTYSFNVAEPVPEPATIFFLGSGLAGLASSLRRRHRSRLSKS